MNDNSDDYEMDTFDNMDDMFQVTDDTDSIKDVFSEYGGWDNINIDVLISKPVKWNFKNMLLHLKPIHWNFERELECIKKLNWSFIDFLDTIEQINWSFLEQLSGIPQIIWPFKPQLLKMKSGKWYFTSQLNELDDSPVRWAFARCLSSSSSVFWGFESQLSNCTRLRWSFPPQICETMRKHRAFPKQLSVSTIRWTFKPQLANLPPINWYFQSQLAVWFIALAWRFPQQLHKDAFAPIVWSFPKQCDDFQRREKGRDLVSSFPHLCDGIRTIPWGFQVNLSPIIRLDNVNKFKKNLDSSISQTSVPWHFLNQITSIKQLNWKFEKLIKQDDLKDISLEQVQNDKKQFQEHYLDNYHKPAVEYRKAVHSKFRRPIDYKTSERITS